MASPSRRLPSAISAADFTTTAGTINRGEVEMSLLGSADYDTMESLYTIPISLSTGDIIYLTDVADIELAEEKNSSISRQNGQENIRISISKNQSANTISICDQIAAVVDDLNAQNLGLTIEITDNSGETIMDNIESVISSLIQGMVISMVVLFLFLGEPKSSMIIALGHAALGLCRSGHDEHLRHDHQHDEPWRPRCRHRYDG